jgi:hypothetical protein
MNTDKEIARVFKARNAGWNPNELKSPWMTEKAEWK